MTEASSNALPDFGAGSAPESEQLNSLALLELSMELKALQRQTPKTPQQHRQRADLIVFIGQLIELAERTEGEKDGDFQHPTLSAQHA